MGSRELDEDGRPGTEEDRLMLLAADLPLAAVLATVKQLLEAPEATLPASLPFPLTTLSRAISYSSLWDLG